MRELWSRLRPHVETRRGTTSVALAALAVHGIQTVIWPVVPGRDYVTYMRVYAEMWNWHSLIPWEMMWRMPVAPAVLGIPLDLFGPWGARIAITAGFVAVVTVWFSIARRYGPACAVAVAAALLLTPSFGLLFHRYSSDVVTAVAFTLLALAFVRLWEHPSTRRAAVAGLALIPVALTRPANQVVVAIVLTPLLLATTRAERLRSAALMATIVIVPLGTWTILNGARFDDRALSRGGGAWLPFYRAYVTDGIISPENGPESRRLAELVRTKLLVREPYRSYGIDETRFWGEPTTRFHEDLVGLTDRELGWDDRNAIMRSAAIEAIRRHPGTFVKGYVRTFFDQLTDPFQLDPPAARDEPDEPLTPSAETDGLPVPSEGGSIPAASFSYWLSRPDNAFDEVWTSPTEHHVVSSDPALLRRLATLERRVAELGIEPTHGGAPGVARWVNRASLVLPPALLWILAGIVGILVRRPARPWPAVVLAGAALAIIAATLASVPPLPEFAAPLLPAFVLVGCVGLLGRRA